MKIVKYFCDNKNHETNHEAVKTLSCSILPNEETIDFEIDICSECLKKVKNNLKENPNNENNVLVSIKNPESEYFDKLEDEFIDLNVLFEMGLINESK